MLQHTGDFEINRNIDWPQIGYHQIRANFAIRSRLTVHTNDTQLTVNGAHAVSLPRWCSCNIIWNCKNVECKSRNKPAPRNYSKDWNCFVVKRQSAFYLCNKISVLIFFIKTRHMVSSHFWTSPPLSFFLNLANPPIVTQFISLPSSLPIMVHDLWKVRTVRWLTNA